MVDQIVLATDHQGLAPAHLIEKAREYAKASKASSTLRTYQSVWKMFSTWCDQRGLVPLPASPETIVGYVVDQAESLKPQTIKKHLSGISQAHKVAGFTSPVTAEPVRLVMQGIRRTRGVSTSPKKALRVEHLRKMVGLPSGGIVDTRDRAILLMGFASGMRRSEIVGLDANDVVFEPEGVVITLRRSKTDQEGRGRQVAVLRGKHPETCPVRAIRAWLDASGITAGPLFVRLDPDGQRERLDGRAVARVVQRTASRAGLDPEFFSGHSLRRGYCTETARGGASEADIARTTGHRSMVVLRGYIEEGTMFSACAARVLDL